MWVAYAAFPTTCRERRIRRPSASSSSCRSVVPHLEVIRRRPDRGPLTLIIFRVACVSGSAKSGPIIGEMLRHGLFRRQTSRYKEMVEPPRLEFPRSEHSWGTK